MARPILISLLLLLTIALLGCAKPANNTFVYHEAPDCNTIMKVKRSKCEANPKLGSLFPCTYELEENPGVEYQSPEQKEVGSEVCVYVEN